MRISDWSSDVCSSDLVEPTAAQIADKAGELAKAAGDGTTWQDHIETAREELMKTGATQAYLKQSRQEGKKKDEGADEEEEAEEGEADEGADDEIGRAHV